LRKEENGRTMGLFPIGERVSLGESATAGILPDPKAILIESPFGLFFILQVLLELWNDTL